MKGGDGSRWVEAPMEQRAGGEKELGRRAPVKASSQGAFLSLNFVLNMAGSHWEGSRWCVIESDLHISMFYKGGSGSRDSGEQAAAKLLFKMMEAGEGLITIEKEEEGGSGVGGVGEVSERHLENDMVVSLVGDERQGQSKMSSNSLI